MDLDDNICYCYRVSLRKLVNFARRTRPTHPSQMAECLGAGTGCGWCIPYLRKIVASQNASSINLPISPADYAAARDRYRATLDVHDAAKAPPTPDEGEPPP